MQSTVMAVPVIRSAGSDVTSVGGGDVTSVDGLQGCQISYNEKTHVHCIVSML